MPCVLAISQFLRDNQLLLKRQKRCSLWQRNWLKRTGSEMAVGVGNIQNNRLAYLYTMPALIVMGMVVLFPFFYNIVLSFSNMNLTHFYDWRITGLKNYVGVYYHRVFFKFWILRIVYDNTNSKQHPQIYGWCQIWQTNYFGTYWF